MNKLVTYLRIVTICVVVVCSVQVKAQYAIDNRPRLRINVPSVSYNNRSVVLSSDRIPNDFLGCTIGVASEVDALKNINQLGIQCDTSTAGASDVITIRGEIECEGARFPSFSMWFYNNCLWKVVFENMKSDSKSLINTLNQKYKRFLIQNSANKFKYRNNGVDLVCNGYTLQYIITGGSEGRIE